jgi:hypothetical protein
MTYAKRGRDSRYSGHTLFFGQSSLTLLPKYFFLAKLATVPACRVGAQALAGSLHENALPEIQNVEVVPFDTE